MPYLYPIETLRKALALFSFCWIACIYVNAQIVPIGPFCANAGSQQLEALPDSGTWGGAADSLGFFDPAIGSNGSPYLVTYSYVDSLGTEHFYFEWIEVLSTPSARIEDAGPFCEDDGIHLLSAQDTGGIWSGPFGVISSDGYFDAWLGELGSPYQIVYTLNDTASGCSASDTAKIIVGAIPQVSLEPLPFVMCLFDEPVQAAGTPAGGIWSGGADSMGIFAPMLNPGGGQVIYTYSDSLSGCSNTIDGFILVENAIIPDYTEAGPFCQEGQPEQLHFTPPTGTFGGAVDQFGYFDPMIGPGEHQVTFTTDCPNCCPYTDTVYVTVHEPMLASANSAGPICELAAPVQLTGIPEGGGWSGAADTTGLFDPSIGIGDHLTVYHILDTNGCANSDTLTINVLSTPEVEIAPAGPFCADDDTFQLTAQPDSGSFVWSGSIEDMGVFDPSSGAGSYEVIYQYLDSGSCPFADTAMLVVNALPVVFLPPVSPFCATDNAVQLSATPTGGTWSGAVDMDGWFDPVGGQVNSPYAVYYDYVDDNQCAGADSIDLIVADPPVVIIDPVGMLCINHGIVQLSATPAGGEWGAAAQLDGTFDPSIGAGSYTATYTVNDGPCVVQAEMNFQVDLCDGISEAEVLAFNVSPNPSNGQFTLAFEKALPKFELLILDASGRTIQKHETNGIQRFALDLSNESAGIYLLIARTEGVVFHRRLQVSPR